MSTIVTDENGKAIQAIRQSTVQNVSIGAGSLQSAVFTETLVRLLPTSACYVRFGENPTVTSANGTLLAAGVPEYFGVVPGQRLAVIQVAAGGTLNITEAL